MEWFFGILVLVALTILAAWKGFPAIFMINAGIAMMCGLYAPDALRALNYSNFGISIGLMLIMYSFVCLGFAYANLFRKQEGREE
jgi:hypothetical protein